VKPLLLLASLASGSASFRFAGSAVRAACAGTTAAENGAEPAAFRSADACGGSSGARSVTKNAIICCSASACDAISSAVDASSSDADAVRCVTWSTSVMARLICVTPSACSVDAAATSRTRSDVLRIVGTSSVRSLPERCAISTVDVARPPMSFAAAWLRSASLRTSAATTAKPRP
jgi:hypothetical protein